MFVLWPNFQHDVDYAEVLMMLENGTFDVVIDFWSLDAKYRQETFANTDELMVNRFYDVRSIYSGWLRSGTLSYLCKFFSCNAEKSEKSACFTFSILLCLPLMRHQQRHHFTDTWNFWRLDILWHYHHHLFIRAFIHSLYRLFRLTGVFSGNLADRHSNDHFSSWLHEFPPCYR